MIKESEVSYFFVVVVVVVVVVVFGNYPLPLIKFKAQNTQEMPSYMYTVIKLRTILSVFERLPGCF